MKAVNIIEELTKSPYDECDGVIHVDKDEIVLRAFEERFECQSDSGINIVWASKSIVNTGGEKGRDFLYIYSCKFPDRDSDIFAILKDGEGEHIYIYEIE